MEFGGSGLSCPRSLQAVGKTSEGTRALSWLKVKEKGRAATADGRKKGYFFPQGENVSVIDTGSLKIVMLRA